MSMLTAVLTIVMIVALQAQGTRIECNFTMTLLLTYSCVVDEVILTRNNTEMLITGAHLPNKTNDDVVVVDMHSLPSIVTEFFTTFPNLSTLFVSDLFHIQQGAFIHAQNLRYLTIRNSPLHVLPAYAFEGAPNINRLTLTQCGTTTINENALVGLAELDYVLVSAKLQELPENIFSSLDNLRSVILLSNNFTTIPSALFDNNLKVNMAYFAYNNIDAVSKSFVDNLYNRNVDQFTFTGNECGNVDISLFFIDRVHTALDQCYKNYEEMFTP